MGMAVLQGPFTVDDYYRMAELGLLHEDDRVELIEGQVVQMTPIGSRHAGCVKQLARLLIQRCGDRALVGVQDPVRLGIRSEPQPDLSVLRPRPDAYRDSHPAPADVWLLIEVADASVGYDRETKVPLYARHGIPELWIVDLPADRIDVHRGPGADGYLRTEPAGRDAELTIQALPDVRLSAEEILG